MKRRWPEEKLANHPIGTSIPPQGHIGAQILNLFLGKVQILGTATSLPNQKLKDLPIKFPQNINQVKTLICDGIQPPRKKILGVSPG